jgi:parallel beta-helix repeat protein
MQYMFYGDTLSASNYDALLNGWATEPVRNSISFNAGNSKYSNLGINSRNHLTGTHSWSISDGGYITDPTINFTSPSTAPGEYIQNFIEANVSVINSSNIVNLTIFLYNQSGLVLQNSSTSSLFFWNITELNYGNYYLNASVIDYQNLTNQTETRNINLTSGAVNCGTLSTVGQNYTLTQNVSSQGTCFTITAANITLDCNNYWINYSINGTNSQYGIYTNQFNTTIKNCNIVDGNWSSESGRGIYLQSSQKSTLLNNSVNTHAYHGILLSSSEYANLTLNRVTNQNSYGIVILYSSGSILLSNNGAAPVSADGILIQGSNNVSLINNIGSAPNQAGIDILGGTNNTLINNTGSGSEGILFQSSKGTLINNTGTGSIGIWVLSASNSTLTNNAGIGAGSYSTGVSLSSSLNITFINQTARTTGNGIDIQQSNNTVFRDCGNISGGKYHIYYASDSGSFNNTFINCSYDLTTNSSKELVQGAGNELIRKWYYQAYVNYSNSSDASNVNVTGYNTTGILQFTAQTNATGWIQRQEIIEYNNTAGTRAYYNNYTITANKSGTNNATNIFNFTTTQNKINDVFTLTQAVNCGDSLDVAGTTYTLANNASSQGTCFTIAAQNITLDCNNYWINYSINGTDNQYGVYTDQFNTTIKNCNIVDGNWSSGTGINRHGIYFTGVNNGTIFNNSVNVSNSYGIYLSSSSNNTLTYNNGTSLNAGAGMYLSSSSNNFLISNNIIGLCPDGMGFGLYISYNSNGNTLINNTATHANYPILISGTSNTFINQIARTTGTTGTRYGVYISNANNTIFRDCINISGATADVYYYTNTLNINNTFINCSYASTNASKESVSGTGNELIRKWYYQAYVNYSNSTGASDVNITAYNTTGILQFTAQTNASGWIGKQEIIEYSNTNGTRTYYNNYTITANKSGTTNATNIFNFTTTQNKVNDVFTLTSTAGYSECGTLSNSGQTYNLTQNVSSQGTCFTIAAQNITLNCNGYWINYSINGTENQYGVYTNQFNTTIRNCNVYDGNWSSGTGTNRYGIYFNGNDNSTLFNNSVNVNNSNGIILNTGANYNNLTLNNVTSNTAGGIALSSSNNNTLTSNTGTSNLSRGIILSSSSRNNNLSYNNGTSLDDEEGIYIAQSPNNTLTSNIGTSNDGNGIFIILSSNNILTFNTGISNSSIGIQLGASHNNVLTSNTGISNSSIGIALSSASNNLLINQTAITTGTSGSSRYGVDISNSNNTIFRDCINISGATSDVYYYSTAGSFNNTFINCSYNTSKETVQGAGNQLIREWYYQAYVNYSNSTAASDVNITAYNTTGILQFTSQTNATGWIQRQEIIEYNNTAGTRSYYNNYTITANKSGTTNATNIFNFTTTQNKINDVFTLTSTAGYSECGTLDSAGSTYILIQNVSSSGTCFTITAQNITLDCNNYQINYSINGTDNQYGIYTDQFNTTVKNCNIIDGNWSAGTGTSRYGIYFNTNDNSTLLNNSVNVSKSNAIYLYNQANFNNLTFNIGTSNTSNGILLSSSSYNNITSNNGISLRSGVGISLGLSSNNILTFNNATSPIDGFYIWASSNNIFISNNGTSLGGGRGIHISQSSNNSLISNILISNTYWGISIYQSNNTIFRDCKTISGGTKDVIVDTAIGSSNNTFINCSYNINKETVQGAGNYLIRKWYYQAYVNYSNSTDASNVNVTGYNTTGILQFTAQTNASGWIQRQEIIEYNNTGGTRSYYNNYTINANKTGTNNATNIFNFTTTQNKVNDVFTLTTSDITPPTYNSVSVNSTTANQIAKFSINVNDDVALNPNGQYIFSTNNSGDWINDTAVNFTATPSWANVTKTLNSTFGIIVGYRWYFNDTSGNTNSTPIYVLDTTSIPSTPPQIIAVYNSTEMTDISSGPNEGPIATYVQLNLTAYDDQGSEDLNHSSVQLNFSLSGEESRVNSSCALLGDYNVKYANYTCNVTMWWWDAPGTWKINASIVDLEGNPAFNDSTTFQIGSTTGFLANSSSLGWPEINPGAIKEEANSPILLNNTGNQQVSVEINATSLVGEINPGYALGANNFSVDTAPGCGGTPMVWYSYTTVDGATIPRGNYTLNDGTAQETIYFCLEQANYNLISQPYSTAQQGSWTIRIFLAVLVIKRRRKKASNKNNQILEIPITVFSTKLGALEAISKYMKENLGKSYTEIGELLSRDERTIWTACKKASEKYKGEIKAEKTDINIPISIFENRKLTIFESIVVYLKEKGMKYNEIGELLNRNQRNIWTIYSRSVKNIGKEGLVSIVALEYNIPITVFSSKLGGLEALSKYMKENLGKSYTEIGELLSRDERTIWTAYKKASEKYKGEIRAEKTDINIPISIFENRKLTIFESIVVYLKEKGMKYNEIGELLNRNQRNIWTIYSRSVKNLEGER